ncbi:MAG: alpha/beta fold hydrolase [Verrucomicrobiaceae bacterium]
MILAHACIGPNEGTPLVFLHGLGAGRSQTTKGLDDLPGFRVIAPDLPGHGDSVGFDPETYSFDSFADHVIALMDHYGIDSCHLGGLSMGSGISLNIALRYPTRVKKLIVLRPSWLDFPCPPHLELAALPGRLSQADFESHAAYQTLATNNPPVAKGVLDLYQRPDNSVLDKMWHDCPFQSLAELSKIPNRTLVLDSPRDDLHPETVAATIAAALPNVQIAHLPARYHEPEAYQKSLNQHLNQFLNS